MGRGDDGILVFLDGALVLDTWHGATAGHRVGAELELDGRPHHLRAYVWDYIGGMDFDVYMQRPQGKGWRGLPLDLYVDPEMARSAGF